MELVNSLGSEVVASEDGSVKLFLTIQRDAAPMPGLWCYFYSSVCITRLLS
jgi:hypothetical protein